LGRLREKACNTASSLGGWMTNLHQSFYMSQVKRRFGLAYKAKKQRKENLNIRKSNK
jgi:hypothetical protein